MTVVFSCRKCGHLMYVPEDVLDVQLLNRLSEKNCPKCGEEGYENWILVAVKD